MPEVEPTQETPEVLLTLEAISKYPDQWILMNCTSSERGIGSGEILEHGLSREDTYTAERKLRDEHGTHYSFFSFFAGPIVPEGF